MKTIKIIPTLLAAALLIMTQGVLASNDDKYLKAMQENISLVYRATTLDALQQSINAFERIAAADPDKWEPLYYQAFGYIMMANLEKESTKKDLHLDQAFFKIEEAKALNQAESEIIALEGFAQMTRVVIDPGTRGAHLSGVTMEAFAKALALDPQNPRALALQAQMQFGTAQFFGSSKAEACATVSAALEKFSTHRSENPLAPQWGKAMAERLNKQCQ